MRFHIPLPKYDTENVAYGYWDGAFTEEQLVNTQKYCSKLKLEDAEVGGQEANQDGSKRNNKIAWLEYNDDTAELYQIFCDVASRINNQLFNFDLTGMHEQIQYSEYNIGEHYGALHQDCGMRNHTYDMPRKLTLTMQLSRPEDYEGGDLKVRIGENYETFD